MAAALVPTVIHTYMGMVVEDGLTTSSISRQLDGFAVVSQERTGEWGRAHFESDDWFERTYASGRNQVVLTVVRSYDLKRLYHHPENDVARGARLYGDTLIMLPGLEGVPVHLLRGDAEDGGTALYVLHYGDGFVGDPFRFQLSLAGELLFRGRRAMTLLFARDVGGAKGTDPAMYPSARVLRAAVQEFVGYSPVS